MIHPATETRRIVRVTVRVDVDICGLHEHQENELATRMTRAARGAVTDYLIGETKAFRPQRTWDVNAGWSMTEERT